VQVCGQFDSSQGVVGGFSFGSGWNRGDREAIQRVLLRGRGESIGRGASSVVEKHVGEIPTARIDAARAVRAIEIFYKR